MSVVSFGGVPAAQYWIDFILWENLLNDNPQVRGIVEIGTWQGGFSWFLWAQTHARRIGFWTCDAVAPERDPPGYFERLDVWARPERIGEVIESMGGPVVLFCDGGNKPRELATFAPACPPGSVVVVHDWGTEVRPSDVPQCLTEAYGDWCDQVGSLTRVFKHGS